MSKSKYNVVNPDALADQYGADAVRLFEMFLGPIEQSKPWDTQGMSGVVGFLKKSVRLMEKRHGGEASAEELRTLHGLIDKLQRDVETLSFNTSVSAMMIAVNAWWRNAAAGRNNLARFRRAPRAFCAAHGGGPLGGIGRLKAAWCWPPTRCSSRNTWSRTA